MRPPGIPPGGWSHGKEETVGIRIHKKLGWALTDVQNDDNGHITDPRISVSSHLLVPPDEVGSGYLGYLEAIRDGEAPESDAWFDVTMTIAMVEEAKKRDGRLPWPVTHTPETGRRDVLLIQPVGFDRWSRYNDPIDHAEECALHDPITPRVIPMPYGIFPFEGIFMDSRDGRRIDSTARRLINLLLDRKDESEEVRPDRQKAADHLAKVLGFDDSDEAQRHMAPAVPSDIRHVISWLNLFNGPDVWLQLRPVLYVYWS
jgi:hypothetical protein